MIQAFMLPYIRYCIILLLFGTFGGCKKGYDPQMKGGVLYTILKGDHESLHPFVTRNQTVLRFRAAFNNSGHYNTTDVNNQADVNKLYGFSDCGGHHQENSARFGWRWYNNRMEILAYCYIDGERQDPILIDTVALNKVNNYSLIFDKDRYVFVLNNKSVVMIPKSCKYDGLRYLLYPYFGGDETAPQEIKIWIEEY